MTFLFWEKSLRLSLRNKDCSCICDGKYSASTRKALCHLVWKDTSAASLYSSCHELVCLETHNNQTGNAAK